MQEEQLCIAHSQCRRRSGSTPGIRADSPAACGDAHVGAEGCPKEAVTSRESCPWQELWPHVGPSLFLKDWPGAGGKCEEC